MPELKYYIVYTKDDDYGRCCMDLVHTTEKNAKEYYHKIEVNSADITTLEKYFDIIDYEEESERSEDMRFYGGE